MPRITTNQIKVRVDIRPGLGSPVPRQNWKRFWAKIISQVQDEVNGEQYRSQKPEDAARRQDDGDKEVADAH